MTGLRPAPGVAHVDDGEIVYAAVLPAGPIVVLDGGAAAIWVAACDGSRASIAERVAEATGASISDVRDDVEAFVEELLARGLLVEASA
ncbi:PqqD family protein [Agromyces mariniharenae]|uniref:PqqD family protein n=1 Tax=Agromyces mariniharenae TaxID=2604423 RepID=A0A5S4V711_9MICO|nr:PqqD family protein [Agromyces mariniharenae]TYL53643.1 PqqD family protein [Agromyces mariniharenae]